MAEYFRDFKTADFVTPMDGIKVKSVHLDNVMMTYMEFEPNTDLPEHAHPHEQITMIHQGRLEMTVDTQTTIMQTEQRTPARRKRLGLGMHSRLMR